MRPITEQFPLGPQWHTVDPFLFCAHHNDHYPPGTADLGPDPELLAGRSIGQDFAGTDGWSMYHGQVVPGFPQHPHRGFETVSFVRRGLVDHSDSLGATARFGRGDVQWMTAGGGVVHAEMFPLVNRDKPNHLELFQIWINLPAKDKMVDPHFSMLWGDQLPTIVRGEEGGPRTEITVIAGELDGHLPPSPPPHSWASRADSDVAVWHVGMEAGATWTLPPARGSDTARTLYLFEGGPITVTESGGDGSEAEIAPSTGALMADSTEPLVVTAGAGGASWMLLQGRPIGEPVAQYGPFVMNDRAGIEQAFTDYQETGFGGWPWSSDDPNHGPDEGRFAHHADGRLERAS
jgi:redox-sensitive bicupin YhaK (pirin superfamily)